MAQSPLTRASAKRFIVEDSFTKVTSDGEPHEVLTIVAVVSGLVAACAILAILVSLIVCNKSNNKNPKNNTKIKNISNTNINNNKINYPLNNAFNNDKQKQNGNIDIEATILRVPTQPQIRSSHHVCRAGYQHYANSRGSITPRTSITSSNDSLASTVSIATICMCRNNAVVNSIPEEDNTVAITNSNLNTALLDSELTLSVAGLDGFHNGQLKQHQNNHTQITLPLQVIELQDRNF